MAQTWKGHREHPAFSIYLPGTWRQLLYPGSKLSIRWHLRFPKELIPLGVLGIFTKVGCSPLAFGASFTWAWQELFEGVNYFRRALGFV